MFPTSIKAEEAVPRFTPIFNGRDLSGWDGKAGYWSVREGVITGETTRPRPLEHHSYLIWRGGMPGDFELRLKFRIFSGNSGVQYRSSDLGDFLVRGYQCNICTSAAGRTGILEEMKNGRGGALAEVGQCVRFDPDGRRIVVGHIDDADRVEQSLDPKGWNELSIVAIGDRLIHKVNGRIIVDVVDRQTNKSAQCGIIALQLHAGRPMKVQFADIRLHEVAAEPNRTVDE